MALITKPVAYGLFSIVALGLVWWAYSAPPATKRAAAKSVARKSSEPDWSYPASETSVRFDHPAVKLRNIFMPLFAVDKPEVKVDEETLMKVPANLAQGESGWAYTGMVEVDGVRLALLENSSTHQGGYVKEGDTWKKSRIVRITMASIGVVGPDGIETTVFRFNANATPKPKPEPEPGFHPIDLGQALKGPIGPKIEITPEGPPTRTIVSSAPASEKVINP